MAQLCCETCLRVAVMQGTMEHPYQLPLLHLTTTGGAQMDC